LGGGGLAGAALDCTLDRADTPWPFTAGSRLTAAIGGASGDGIDTGRM
jgi:hypothetical protein